MKSLKITFILRILISNFTVIIRNIKLIKNKKLAF